MERAHKIQRNTVIDNLASNPAVGTGDGPRKISNLALDE